MGEHRCRWKRDNDSCGILERDCRAVVDRAHVDLGVVLGGWHEDRRQDVDGQIWIPRRHVTPFEMFLASR